MEELYLDGDYQIRNLVEPGCADQHVTISFYYSSFYIEDDKEKHIGKHEYLLTPAQISLLREYLRLKQQYDVRFFVSWDKKGVRIYERGGRKIAIIDYATVWYEIDNGYIYDLPIGTIVYPVKTMVLNTMCDGKATSRHFRPTDRLKISIHGTKSLPYYGVKQANQESDEWFWVEPHEIKVVKEN